MREFIIVRLVKLLRLIRGEVPTSTLVKRGLSVGKGFSRQGGCRVDFSYAHLIQIGDDVELAPNVTILAHDNSLKRVIGLCKIGKIGNLVFVGAGSTILPNVSIGDNVIIGVGSVVTKNLEADTVYAGVPAKPICSVDNLKKRVLLNINNWGGILERKYSSFNLSDDEKKYMKLVCEKGSCYLQSENYPQLKKYEQDNSYRSIRL